MKLNRKTKWVVLALGAGIVAGILWYGVPGTARFRQRIMVKTIRELAENGDADAQNALGGAYYIGEISPFRLGRNDKEAVKWSTKAAEQGNDMAQCLLGHLYFEGKGVAQDYSVAAMWYTKSAQQGRVVLAQSALGMMYARGQGVPQDDVEAYKWLVLAAAPKDANEMGAIRQRLSAAQVAEAEKWAQDFKAKMQGDK